MEFMANTRLFEFLAEGDIEQMASCFRQAINETLEDCRISFLHRSGEQIGCLIKFIPIEVRGEVVGMYAMLKDMRKLDKAVSKFLESERRFRIIAENVHDVIVLLNAEKEYVYVSPSSKTIYDFEPEELVNQPHLYNVHPDEIEMAEEKLTESVHTGGICKMQVRLKHHSKGWIWSEVHGTPIYDDQKNFLYMVMIVRDISFQKEYEEQLEYFAYHDALSGLPNRRFFTNRVSKSLEGLKESGDPFAVMILDVDHFKEINDQYGHEIGNHVIHEFGRRLSGAIGEKNLAARLGGDEFIVLLSDTDTEEQAAYWGDKVRQALRKQWQFEGMTLYVSTSMGVALARPSSTFNSLTKKADRAMYQAKKAGRDCYRIAADE